MSPMSSAVQASTAVELGVGVQALGGQRVDERADRGAVAAHEQLEPVLGGDLDREVPVGGVDRVAQRLGRHAALGVPARGALVEPPQLARQLLARAGAQQLREQAVVAVPLAVRVESEHEPIGALERRQHVRAGTLVGERVGEVGADPVDDRRPQQERALPGRLAVEHLGDQVVAHDAVVARELLDEALGSAWP